MKSIYQFLGFIILFLFFQTNLVANPPEIVDSLETQLKNAKNLQEEIEVRNTLAELYFKFNVNTSLTYIEANLNQPEITKFPFLRAKSFYLKGRANLFIANFDTASSALDEAKVYFLENGDFKELGDCYKDLGTIQLHQNNYRKAENFYLQGIEAYEKGNYPAGFAHCNLNLGNVYIEQYFYTQGIQFYYNALEKYEALGMNRYMGMCNNNIGNIYKDVRNFSKAHEHYQKAKASYKIDRDSLQIINVNLNIGSTFLDQGEYDKAIQIFYKTLTAAKATGFMHPVPTTYNNLTASHINLGNFDLAEKNNTLALEYASAQQNKLEMMSAHLLSSEIQLRRKNYQKAIEFANIAYEDAKQQKQLNVMADASENLYLGYKNTNQYAASLSYLEIHKTYRDSLFNENRMKIPLSKDFAYQLDKQKREQVIQQEKDKLAYEAKLSFQRVITFGFAIGFIILGLSAFLIYKNLGAKRVAELELEKKNAILEKYIESNIQLEQFAHIASHDLKSPLRTVGSFSSLLKRRAKDKLNSDELEYLDMISNAAKLMWNLVDDLMTYSQVNSLQMNLVSTDANVLLEEVVNNLDFSIKEKDALVEISPMPKKVMVDETKLRQVFQNLIANALKFTTAETTPHLQINCVAEGAFWKFSIQDNGIGISEEYHDKIFKPYKQLHTKDKFEGTGMGLAICKKIVEKHGGTIHFESRLGEGTTFFFTIPASTEVAEVTRLVEEAVA